VAHDLREDELIALGTTLTNRPWEHMHEDPRLDPTRIVATLDAQYSLEAASVTFLPLSLDDRAAVYEVVAVDGRSWFLKITFGPVRLPGLLVPSALVERGIPNILAPVRTRTGVRWCPFDGNPELSVVLFPFISGGNAKVVGMSDEQWRAFGRTLRAVHDSGLGEHFRELLGIETFTLPSAAKVRRLLDIVAAAQFESPAARRHATFWRENAGRTTGLLDRAEALGRTLQRKPFAQVLCHGDIHGANILVAEDGRIFLSDWDGPPGPLIAPRERDLLFVIGSRIARPVEPREEPLFFEGYGPVIIDRDTLVYFRWERIVQDIGEYGESVFLGRALGEAARAEAAAMGEALFTTGGTFDVAETVAYRYPGRNGSIDNLRATSSNPDP